MARQPQQDRSRATRQRLLEAAIECLAEVGWAGSTVAVVAERAGVSRGAAQHHFPTREDLFAAAVDYVTEVRTAWIREHSADLPSTWWCGCTPGRFSVPHCTCGLRRALTSS
jgi:AcrR family transcriptional regulator